MQPEKKPQSKGFFCDIYEDQFKWFVKYVHYYYLLSRSLVKSVSLYGLGIFGFFVIYSGINAPPELL